MPLAAAAPQPVVTVLAARATGMAADGLGRHAEGAAAPLTRLWCNCDQRLAEGGARVQRLEGEAAWLAWWEGAAALGLAVTTALALQAEVEAFRVRLPIAVALRIGIGVGLARAGWFAGPDIRGPAVGLAERLAQAAPPGGVLIIPSPGAAAPGLT